MQIKPPNSSQLDAPKKAQNISDQERIEREAKLDEMLDTWTFAGQTLRAPEMQMPAPFAAAFKPSHAPALKSPPYEFDHSQLSLQVVAGGAPGDDELYIDISLYGGDCIAAVTPLGQDFLIELVNAKDGKFPVTQEQLLRAVHAGKLELEASGLP